MQIYIITRQPNLDMSETWMTNDYSDRPLRWGKPDVDLFQNFKGIPMQGFM